MFWCNPGLYKMFDAYSSTNDWVQGKDSTRSRTAPYYIIKGAGDPLLATLVKNGLSLTEAFVSGYFVSDLFTKISGSRNELIVFYDANNNKLGAVTTVLTGITGIYPYIGFTNAAGTLIAVSTASLNDEGLTIEVDFKSDPTAGIVGIWVNGIKVVDFYGATGNAVAINKVIYYVGAPNIETGLSNCALSDIIISDKRIGDQHVTFLEPNGDTAVAGWAVSGTPVYQQIADSTAIANSYMAATSVGLAAEFTLTSIPETVAAITAVQPMVSALYMGNSAAKSVALTIADATAKYTSTKKAVGTVLTNVSETWETDPATGLPWLPSVVNSLKIGVVSEA